MNTEFWWQTSSVTFAWRHENEMKIFYYFTWCQIGLIESAASLWVFSQAVVVKQNGHSAAL